MGKPTTEGSGDGSGMRKAYQIAHELLRDRLRQEDPEALEELESITESDIVVVSGSFDHIGAVLELSKTPHTRIHPNELDEVALRPDQVVFVNCPGNIRARASRNLTSFVSEGGFLFTTDWALKHVIEPAFPGYLEYNGKRTRDEVVRVELLETEDPFLRSLLGPEDDPQWWLEGSSYPIRVLAPEKVNVMIQSRELEERHGEAPVLVSFEHEEGKVYHMISHFYLQRTETRTKRHELLGSRYMDEKGIPRRLRAKYLAMGIEEMKLGEIEAAYTSSSALRQILIEKKRWLMRLSRKEREAKETTPKE